MSYSADIPFDFTMCNPPFYGSREEVFRSADAKELGPSAVCTGTDNEMITDGGEAKFVAKMVKESKHLKTRCRYVSYPTRTDGHYSNTKQMVHLDAWKVGLNSGHRSTAT